MSFVKSATSEGLADVNGVPHSEYVSLYAQIAQRKELSIIITGHIAVSKESRPEPRCVYLTDGEAYPHKLRTRNLHRCCVAVKQANPNIVFLAQLNHGGRQIPRVQLMKNDTKHCCSPAECAIKNGLLLFKSPNCQPSNKRYIKDQFVSGSLQMKAAGFDGVQVHCAHGYLFSDCLKYGMSCFVLETLQEIRDAVGPAFVLAVKVNADEENLDFIKKAAEIVQYVELSKGSYERPQEMMDNHRSRPALAFAAAHPELMDLKSCKIIATGGFHTLDEGYSALTERSCHMVGFGRLYCLPQQTKVERVQFGRAVKALQRVVPLALYGPQTMYYEELLRRRAKGLAGSNEAEARRAGLIWWLICLLLWVLGF